MRIVLLGLVTLLLGCPSMGSEGLGSCYFELGPWDECDESASAIGQYDSAIDCVGVSVDVGICPADDVDGRSFSECRGGPGGLHCTTNCSMSDPCAVGVCISGSCSQ
jgi:hypothetical protein